ncbi:MAG: hypothetical protein RRY16_03110 [Bacilli bacterium]
MKKYVKFIVLFFIVLVLTGCGVKWEDIYDKNKNVFDKGFSCKYVNANDSIYDIKNINFIADANGFYSSFNNGSREIIISKDKKFVNTTYVNGSMIAYDQFEIIDYLNDYKGMGCPNSIYIVVDNTNVAFKYKCTNSNGCPFRYDLEKLDNGTSPEVDGTHDNEGNKCIYPAALSCKNYEIDLKNNDNLKKVYIQLGIVNIDEIEKKYMSVSDNINFEGEYHSVDTYGSISTILNQNNFYLLSENYDKIFLNDGKYKTNISLKYNSDGNSTQYEIIPEKLSNSTDGFYEGSEESNNSEDVEIPKPNIEGISLCDENGIQQSFQVIGYLLFVVKILVPLLLIILGTIDFSKAIITSDDKAIKEASSKLIKRVIIGVVIFLIPTILNFAFSLVDGAKETSSGFTKCTDCLFNPNDKTKCSPKKIGE